MNACLYYSKCWEEAPTGGKNTQLKCILIFVIIFINSSILFYLKYIFYLKIIICILFIINIIITWLLLENGQLLENTIIIFYFKL